LHDTQSKTQERALLVGVCPDTDLSDEVEESMRELARLADTAGAYVVDQVIQYRHSPNPAYYIGSGKAAEIAEICKEQEVDLVIFDNDLSPAQVKNLDRSIERRILDRSGLILDIFASRARSKQARIQVELAQLKYMLPRLTRQWSHLSRQAGGVGSGGAIGVRGPGETQLEVDRRLVRGRIEQLSRALEHVEEAYQNQRKGRIDKFCVTLVGYTNAGKSTVFNALTQAGTLIEDRLFATLDATTRIVPVSGGQDILLSDTVGFIRKLPHHLVASFKSTLMEVFHADLLLHVVDASHPQWEAHMETVGRVLDELGVHDIPMIPVFNKRDAVEDFAVFQRMQRLYPDGVAVSALDPADMERLRNKVFEYIDRSRLELGLVIPYTEARYLATVYESGDVIFRADEPNGVRLVVRVMPAAAGKLNRLLDRFVA